MTKSKLTPDELWKEFAKNINGYLKAQEEAAISISTIVLESLKNHPKKDDSDIITWNLKN